MDLAGSHPRQESLLAHRNQHFRTHLRDLIHHSCFEGQKCQPGQRMAAFHTRTGKVLSSST
jgi:hypothetical protein